MWISLSSWGGATCNDVKSCAKSIQNADESIIRNNFYILSNKRATEQPLLSGTLCTS